MLQKTPEQKTARQLLNYVPEDGCLLVFNASPQAWYNAVSVLGHQHQVRKIIFGVFLAEDVRNMESFDVYVTRKE